MTKNLKNTETLNEYYVNKNYLHLLPKSALVSYINNVYDMNLSHKKKKESVRFLKENHWRGFIELEDCNFEKVSKKTFDKFLLDCHCAYSYESVGCYRVVQRYYDSHYKSRIVGDTDNKKNKIRNYMNKFHWLAEKAKYGPYKCRYDYISYLEKLKLCVKNFNEIWPATENQQP